MEVEAVGLSIMLDLLGLSCVFSRGQHVDDGKGVLAVRVGGIGQDHIHAVDREVTRGDLYPGAIPRVIVLQCDVVEHDAVFDGGQLGLQRGFQLGCCVDPLIFQTVRDLIAAKVLNHRELVGGGLQLGLPTDRLDGDLVAAVRIFAGRDRLAILQAVGGFPRDAVIAVDDQFADGGAALIQLDREGHIAAMPDRLRILPRGHALNVCERAACEPILVHRIAIIPGKADLYPQVSLKGSNYQGIAQVVIHVQAQGLYILAGYRCAVYRPLVYHIAFTGRCCKDQLAAASDILCLIGHQRQRAAVRGGGQATVLASLIAHLKGEGRGEHGGNAVFSFDILQGEAILIAAVRYRFAVYLPSADEKVGLSLGGKGDARSIGHLRRAGREAVGADRTLSSCLKANLVLAGDKDGRDRGLSLDDTGVAIAGTADSFPVHGPAGQDISLCRFCREYDLRAASDRLGQVVVRVDAAVFGLRHRDRIAAPGKDGLDVIRCYRRIFRHAVGHGPVEGAAGLTVLRRPVHLPAGDGVALVGNRGEGKLRSTPDPIAAGLFSGGYGAVRAAPSDWIGHLPEGYSEGRAHAFHRSGVLEAGLTFRICSRFAVDQPVLHLIAGLRLGCDGHSGPRTQDKAAAQIVHQIHSAGLRAGDAAVLAGLDGDLVAHLHELDRYNCVLAHGQGLGGGDGGQGLSIDDPLLDPVPRIRGGLKGDGGIPIDEVSVGDGRLCIALHSLASAADGERPLSAVSRIHHGIGQGVLGDRTPRRCDGLIRGHTSDGIGLCVAGRFGHIAGLDRGVHFITRIRG